MGDAVDLLVGGQGLEAEMFHLTAHHFLLFLDLRGDDPAVQLKAHLTALTLRVEQPVGRLLIHLDGDGFRQIAAINTAGHKATPPQLVRFCLFVPFFYFDNVHCDPPCNMVYIKRKTSFSASGKKQKPFFSDGSFYLVFSSRTPADCRICKKEGPSIQRPAAWYQKPFFNRRFFFEFSSL